MARFTSPESDVPEWVESSPGDPCPVCGAQDGCKVCEDRSFACCLNVIGERPVVTGGWLHRLHMVKKRLVPA